MIGVGVDTVDVERFRQVLERQPGLLSKLFTEDERAYAEQRVDGAPSLAVRFAAKEATMKALGVGLGAFGFHDVSIANEPGGAPKLLIVGQALELAVELGVTSWHVSLTHTCSSATAMVLAE